MRSGWIRVDPNSITGVLIRRSNFVHRERPRESGGRDQSDAGTNPGMPRIAGNHRKPEPVGA